MNIIKILCTFLFYSSILIVCILITLMSWIPSESGKKYIIEKLNKYSYSYAAMYCKIEDLDISFPFLVKIKKLSFHDDSQSEFINIENIKINISPNLLLLYKINIDNLSIDKVNIIKKNQYIINNKNNILTKKIHKLLIIPSIIIKKLTIQNVILSPKVTNIKQEISFGLTTSLKYKIQSDYIIFNSNINNILLAPTNKYINNSSANIKGSIKLSTQKIQIIIKNIITSYAKIIGDLTINNNQILANLEYTSNAAQYLLNKIKIKSIQDIITGTVNISYDTNKAKIDSSGIITLKSSLKDKTHKINWNANCSYYKNKIIGLLNAKLDNLALSSNIIYSNLAISLPNLIITNNYSNHFGKIDINLLTETLTADINSKFFNFEKAQHLVPLIQEGTIDITSTYLYSPTIESISIQGTANNFITQLGQAKNIDFYINIPNIKLKKINGMQITINDLLIKNYYYKNIIFKIPLQNNKNYITALLYSNEVNSINLSMLIDQPKSDNNTIIIKKLLGEINQYKIYNENNIYIEYGENYKIKINKIKINNTDVKLLLKKENQDIDLNLKINQIPLFITKDKSKKHLNPSLISGEINFFGNLNKYNIHSQIYVKNIIDNINNITDLKIQSVINQNLCKIHSTILCNNSPEVTIDMNIPFSFQPFPIKLIIEKDLPIYAKIHTKHPFNFCALIPQNENIYSGLFHGMLEVTGSYRNPILKGKMLLKNGYYLNKEYGINIYNIESTITTNNNKLILSNIKAFDYLKKNTINGNGYLTLEENMPFLFKLYSNNFYIINSFYMQAQSKIDCIIAGNKDKGTIKGKLKLGPVYINIHNRTTIPSLNIKQILNSNEIIEQNNSNNIPYEILLDLALTTQDKIYLKGLGINAILEGNLNVIGPLNNKLKIKGLLECTQGHYHFIKMLDISKGTLIFDGTIPPYPFLQITSSHIENNNNINLLISGPIMNPILRIYSIPYMPPEQILSRLLFNKDINELSLFHTIQIIDNLRLFSFKGHKMSILHDIVPNFLNLDSIFITTKEKELYNTYVGIGKHINEKFYIAIEQGINSFDTNTLIRIQIAPKIFIYNSNESLNKNVFGIKWSFNY